jgi:SAM-dependent methyltransferase
MNGGLKSWDTHYTRSRSALNYPDENLVRMLKPWVENHTQIHGMSCLDLGCGSGRHLALARNLGFGFIAGSDISYNGLTIAKQFNAPLICADSTGLPFKSNSFDAVIAWGSLHYGRKHTLRTMTSEINRILKDNGTLFGTLRSAHDTMMRKGTDLGHNEWLTSLDDIKDSIVSFYSEDELVEAFSQFTHFSYGRIERTQLGKTDQVISHWYFRADK